MRRRQPRNRIKIRRGLSTWVCAWAVLVVAMSFYGYCTGAIGIPGVLLLSVFPMFASIVVAHDATHRAAHDNRRINNWVGWVSCFLVAMPFPFFKKAHLIHHGRLHTDEDVDLWVHGRFWQFPPLPIRWMTGNFNYYRVWSKVKPRERAAGVGVAAAWILAAIAFPQQVLLGLLLPMQVAVGLFAFFTAYLPHGVFYINLPERGEVPESQETWGFQWLTLFHDDHHNKPAYPFNQYPELFATRIARHSWWARMPEDRAKDAVAAGQAPTKRAVAA